MKKWYQDGFAEAMVQGNEIEWLKEYFLANVEKLKLTCQTLIGSEGKETNYSIEMGANDDKTYFLYVEDEFGKEIFSCTMNNSKESIEKGYNEALKVFNKITFDIDITPLKPKSVYGIISNTGDGDVHLWHLGVCLTEEEAYEKLGKYLNNNSWIGEIEIL